MASPVCSQLLVALAAMKVTAEMVRLVMMVEPRAMQRPMAEVEAAAAASA
jgi:hypothetical protein